MRTIISVDSLKIYAFHGVLPQERAVGNDFEVTVNVELDMDEEYLQSDSIENTLNYALIVEIIKDEMEKPSNLLENVAYRILSKVKSLGGAGSLKIVQVDVDVSKLSPPISCTEVKSTGVRLRWSAS